MRILSAIVVAALIGVLTGGAIAYVEDRSDPDALNKLSNDLAANANTGSKEVSHIVVDEPSYNFGSMQRGTTKSHEFVIRNTGNAPLKIRNGGTTCKCTLSKVAEESIAPNGSTKVKLEWTAKIDAGPFTQEATILTNDPIESQIKLTVNGQVLALSGVEPADFLFDKLSVGETRTAQVYVMAMLQDELTVKGPADFGPHDSRQVRCEARISRQERAAEQTGQTRLSVSITAKDGLPVGRFHAWLTLHTNLTDAEKLEIPIVGQVVGDISVGGITGWNEEQGVLNIGSVKSSEGGHATANLMVRGADASEVKFQVKSKEPEELKVTLGEPQKVKDTLVRVPINIEIPPGTRPMVHLDTAQGEAGRIVFSTTHSKIKELSLSVRFAVER